MQFQAAWRAATSPGNLSVMGNVICRYCGQPFTPKPGKPGYIDECPVCLAERSWVPRPQYGLEDLMEEIVAHPITVHLDGRPVLWKTRAELVQKLKRKGLDRPTITPLLDAYMDVIRLEHASRA